MKIKLPFAVIAIMIFSFLLTSCAIPLSSIKEIEVNAVHTNEYGKEVSRIETVDKYRKWQYFISPEGPVRKNYWVKSDIYLVCKNKRKKIDFLPITEDYPKVYFTHFFPLNNPDQWVALGVRSLFREDWTEIDIVKFDKDGVIDITRIQDCRVELVHGSRKSQWKKHDNTLQFETKHGRVTFDLTDGKLKK